MPVNVNISSAPSIHVNVAAVFTNWIEVLGNATQAVNGEGYIINRAVQHDVTLPLTANVGDSFAIKGAGGTGDYIVSQNAGQSIKFETGLETTVGVAGFIQATTTTTGVVFICIVQDTVWSPVEGFTGCFLLQGAGDPVCSSGVATAPSASAESSYPFYIRGASNTFETDKITVPFSGGSDYSRAAYYEPFIFICPLDSPVMPIINTIDKSVDTSSVVIPGGNQKWGNIIIAPTQPNPKAYLIPQDFNGVGIVDVKTKTFLGTIPGGFNDDFWAAYLDWDNNIICIPGKGGSSAMKINTSNDTLSFFGNFPGPGDKFDTVVLSSYDGRGYAIPRDADYFAIIDSYAETVDVTTFSGFAGATKYRAGAEGSDFKIYCPGASSTITAIIDPMTLSIDTTTIVGNNGFTGAGLHSNNKIYAANGEGINHLGIIDVATQTMDVTSVSGLPGPGPGDRMNGFVSCNNGEGYTIPQRAAYSTIVRAGVPVIDPRWCTSSYGNGST